MEVQVAEGTITVASMALNGLTKGPFNRVSARLGKDSLAASLKTEASRRVVSVEQEINVTPANPLEITLTA